MSLVSTGVVADVGPATTFASGLMNPRGIAFAPNGSLYVVEAGMGGTGPCTFSPPNPAIPRCYGETGALSQILPTGEVRRVLTGLPSLAQPGGLVEGGPTDVAFLGTSAHVVMGWGGDPAIRETLGINTIGTPKPTVTISHRKKRNAPNATGTRKPIARAVTGFHGRTAESASTVIQATSQSPNRSAIKRQPPWPG